jgi:isoleucyl-tRNA synthetase
MINFCSLELSAFYFDIRKDVLYCDDLSSTKRKACINLLGLILDMLLKWFAPVLSFTTEEIFQIINKEKNSSIHLQTFPKIPKEWKNEKLYKKWEKFKLIKKVVNAAIEAKRANKDIGSSLEANVKVFLSEDYLNIVKDFDLSESFITSKAQAEKFSNDVSLFKIDEVKGVGVLVNKAKGEKCPRCWKIFQGPCQRCSVTN